MEADVQSDHRQNQKQGQIQQNITIKLKLFKIIIFNSLGVL